MPVSPDGHLDGFTWKVPLAEISVTRPVIEVTSPPAKTPTPLLTQASPPPPDTNRPGKSAKPRKAAKAAKEKPVEPVIPLVHAPDDPGPDPVVESEQASEPPPLSPWQRFVQLFR